MLDDGLLKRIHAAFGLIRMLSDRHEIKGGSVANLPNIHKIAEEMERDLRVTLTTEGESPLVAKGRENIKNASTEPSKLLSDLAPDIQLFDEIDDSQARLPELENCSDPQENFERACKHLLRAGERIQELEAKCERYEAALKKIASLRGYCIMSHEPNFSEGSAEAYDRCAETAREALEGKNE